MRHLRCRLRDRDHPRVGEMVEPEVDRVGAGGVGELVHERLVRERVLDPIRPAERGGQERVPAGVGDHPLARDDVGGDAVRVVDGVRRQAWRRRRRGREAASRGSRAGSRSAGSPAGRGGCRGLDVQAVAVPDGHLRLRAGGVDGAAERPRVRGPEVLRVVLVGLRVLHPHRLADGLGDHRGVERGVVGGAKP